MKSKAKTATAWQNSNHGGKMIQWQQMAEDDFIAYHLIYTLRVEQLDEYLWWWNVECLGNEIASNTVGTKEAAMAAAESKVREAIG